MTQSLSHIAIYLPSTGKTSQAAPPVSILKRPQPAAVPTPAPKAVAKEIPPQIPAAKATTAPQPAHQGKASGSPSIVPVTQTPTVPNPREREGGVDGSHTTIPAMGADAVLEPVQGRVDDDTQEDFPALSARPQLTVIQKVNRKRKARFNKALEKQRTSPPGAMPPPAPSSKPTKDDDGFIQVQGRIRPHFATVTQRGASNATTSKAHATNVGQAQGRRPTGRPFPNTTRPPPTQGTTQVVVIRNGGYNDRAAERALHERPTGAIVREVQAVLNTKTAQPLKILSGRWAQTYDRTGNFVYTLLGELPMAHVQAYQTILTRPFGGGHLVTTRGWNWANIKEVIRLNPDTDTVWEEDELLKELRSNPMFATATISVPPYWLGNPFSFQGDRGIIVFAYEDLNNKITQAAIDNGVAMFGARARFIPMGDVPQALQCGRCWQMGHRTDWPECPTPGNQVLCFKCGGQHATINHDYECKGTHAVIGKCNCKLKCILCGNGNHNARSQACPKRKGAGAVRPAPLRPAGWIRPGPAHPGLGPANHRTTEPPPPPAKPKKGTSALLSKEQWEKTRADMMALGNDYSEERFLEMFPISMIAPPIIPFPGISEAAFFDTFEQSVDHEVISNNAKILAENKCDRWDADVAEGTAIVWLKKKEYTARIEDLPHSWYDMQCLERVRNQAVADGDINAYRVRVKPSHRTKVNADLAKSTAFCQTNPDPGFTGGFLKPRALPCLVAGIKRTITDFEDLPYA